MLTTKAVVLLLANSHEFVKPLKFKYFKLSGKSQLYQALSIRTFKVDIFSHFPQEKAAKAEYVLLIIQSPLHDVNFTDGR